MKTLRMIFFAPLFALQFLGLAVCAVIATYAEKRLCLYDVAPTDVKSLHAAMEKAFDAMKENIAKVQDTASKALEETRQEGTLHKATNDELKKLGEAGNALATGFKELRDRMQDLEQKGAHKPGGGEQPKSNGQMFVESEEYKAISGKADTRGMGAVKVGSFHKVAIVNATGQNQPLVVADRLAGIVYPALRRLTIRDLLPRNTTQSNLIEFASENVFTNNAGPQYDASPGSTEGAPKAESAITFTLNNTAVVTLAHWIPISRQVLSDAPMLQGYVDGRLRYGLALEEEDEMLNSSGSAGELNGLVNQATAFTGGSTNQTALDTLLKAFLQISLSNYEASGVVLHPVDWTNIMLLKDTTGRYLFSDPHSAESPRVWGKDVVATAAQTQGQFLAGAFSLAAEIFDREDATVRFSEQHSDFFTRNLVALLAEERLALALYRATAIVKGAISYAG